MELLTEDDSMFDEVLLPQTEEEFDHLVQTLFTAFKLKDMDHTAMIVANQIQRLPPEQCVVTPSYLGRCVLKSIAYSVALHKTRKLSQKAQIDHLAALLKTNPYDQQALDALEAASSEGSDYAKEILSLYRPVEAGKNALPIQVQTDAQGHEIPTIETAMV